MPSEMAMTLPMALQSVNYVLIYNNPWTDVSITVVIDVFAQYVQHENGSINQLCNTFQDSIHNTDLTR